MCLILFNVPITLKHVFDILSVCFFHVIWESIVNHRRLKLSTLSMTTLSIVSVNFIFVVVVFFLNHIGYFDFF